MNLDVWLPPAAVAWMTLGLGVVVVVLVICLMVLSGKLSKLRKSYLKVMNGGSVDNIEALFLQINSRLDDVSNETKRQKDRLSVMEAVQKKMKAKVGLYRYNAFGDRGSDQSFSFAIMDESQDGVVLTGIHTRDETYIYAKPLEKGQSSYALSPEEKEAINRSSDS
jgi:hypothetical protein